MDKICPELSGVDLDGKLVEITCKEHACAKWIQVQGTHPQTGEPLSEYDCTHNWQTVLLIENSQQQRQTGAAIESLRNEVVVARAQGPKSVTPENRIGNGNGH
jgi:hypothetical protein